MTKCRLYTFPLTVEIGEQGGQRWAWKSRHETDLTAFPINEVKPQLWMESLSQNAREKVWRGKKREKTPLRFLA